jgi:hypothetical protein
VNYLPFGQNAEIASGPKGDYCIQARVHISPIGLNANIALWLRRCDLIVTEIELSWMWV